MNKSGMLERPVGERILSLENVTLGGRPLPALPIHASRLLELLGVEGMLGLDFLDQFTDVHFNGPSGRLILRR